MRRKLSVMLLAGLIALLTTMPGKTQPQANDNDTLDLSGDWTLTTGFTPGLVTDDTPARHWVPAGATTVYEVHFDRQRPTAYGMKYHGYYKNLDPNHPLGRPGALQAETFYANRGVYVVQIIEPSPTSFQYFLVRSGKHQPYPTDDPTRVEVLGGWTDIGGNIGNFTLVKLPN
jgi:hypothetical protein